MASFLPMMNNLNSHDDDATFGGMMLMVVFLLVIYLIGRIVCSLTPDEYEFIVEIKQPVKRVETVDNGNGTMTTSTYIDGKIVKDTTYVIQPNM